MKVILNSFTAGELSPRLEGRTDIPNLAKGCRLLRNMLPSVVGGAFRRPGLKYAWASRDNADRTATLIPFIFSNSDSAVIEAGNYYFRFGVDGELVEEGGDELEILTPWGEDETIDLKYVQVNDVMYFAHPDHPPQRMTRVSATEWELTSFLDIFFLQDADDGFPWPPFLDENVGPVTITPSGTTGGITLTASDDLFVANHQNGFFQIAHRRDTAYDELIIPVFPAASTTIDFRVNPVAGQQHTIAGTTYTWKATADVTGPYMVEIGVDAEASRGNFKNAINGTGSGFGPGTAQHQSVEATSVDLDNDAAATAVLTGDGSNKLSFPNLSGTMNVVVTIGSTKYGFMANPVDTLFNGATYNVKMGATEKASLQNLVKAINASGVNNTDYYGPSGVTAHTDVTAALTADNQVTVTAKTAGASGNSIAVSVSDTVLAPEPLVWSATTLKGGGASSFRLKVSARASGLEGNSITVGGMYYGLLTSTDAGVTNVSNNNTVTVGSQTYTFKTALTPAANEVLIGADWDASMLNLIRAINLTGTPGTDYGAATTINASAFAGAAVTSADQVVIVSKIVNPTTSIALSEVAATITASAATLQHPWNSTTLVGGSEVDIESTGFEVLGGYSITSYGLWKGTVILERQRQDESWEALQQWRGNNDRNVTTTGTAEYPQKLRFRVVDGVGTASADVDAPRFVIEAYDAKIYGLVQITNYISPTVAEAWVVKDLFSTEATYQWAEGAWSEHRGWPAAVAIHDQRLVFMATSFKPQTMWLSATADFHNFRRGVNDADGFTRDLAASESSPIVAAVSLGHGLIILKESQEWLAAATDGQSAVTPTNLTARQQSAYGCENVMPLTIGPRIIFVKSGGRTLSDYQYAWDTQEFAAVDLNELSDHLTRAGVKQMAFQRRPDSIVWCVTNDGRLLSMHYRREKEFIAWAYHKLSGTAESLCCIPGDNDRDDLYVLTNRTLGGGTKRYVERLDSATPFELEEDDIDDAAQRALLCYLDCSKFQTGASSMTWSGLDHLEGESVAVQADGSYHAPVVVSGGSITLTRAATSVLAGIDYSDDSPLQPYGFDIQGRNGTSTASAWQVSELAFRFYRASSCRYADDEDSPFKDVKIREASDDVNAPVKAFTGLTRVGTRPKHQDSVRIVLKPTGAEPMGVLALCVGVNITG